ncbi:MAG: hypothetical protein JWN58_278 [Gammaproteobacteria bacterium]|nr:hypothetical protein [Gammaproteobacteria bacterium]
MNRGKGSIVVFAEKAPMHRHVVVGAMRRLIIRISRPTLNFLENDLYLSLRRKSLSSRHASGLFKTATRLTPLQVGFGSKSSRPRTNAITKLAKMSSNPTVVHTKSDTLGDSIFRFIEASIEVFNLSSRPVAETCSTLDLRRRSQKSFSQGTAINIGPVAPKRSLRASHKEYVI